MQFFKIKERKVLSWQGWLMVFLSLSLIFSVYIITIHSFLALTKKVNTDVLIIEGWMPDYAIEFAVKEFKENGYKKIFVTGGPISKGSHLFKYKTFAGIAADSLKHFGLKEEYIKIIPAPFAKRDRTYLSALTLKNWIKNNNIKFKSANLISFGCHARRSLLLFQKALGSEVEIGVISIKDWRYDSKKWVQTSYGVKSVFNETISYIYTKLFIMSVD